MEKIYGFVFGAMLVSASVPSFAKQTPVPSDKLSADARAGYSSNNIPPEAVSNSSPMFRPLSGPPDTELIRPTHAAGEARVIDSKYVMLNGLHLGMALLDVQLTQHCIATHQCSEGNPLMPSSRGGQLSVDFAYVGYSAFISYKLKKRHLRLWWISPTAGVAAHTAGVATGLMH